MQEEIPYKSYMAATTAPAGSRSSPNFRKFLDGSNNGGGGRPVSYGGNETSGSSVRELVMENAVIVFGRRGCCMCHVVKRLLLGLGVNPAVGELDEEKEEVAVNELAKLINNGVRAGGDDGGGIQFPVVFVGGKLFGGLDRIISTHISGELVPILKDAGALWL